MDYSHYLKKYLPDGEKLLKFGFEERAGKYVLERTLSDSDLYAKIWVSPEAIEIKVFDRAFDDEYLPFNVLGGTDAVKGEVENLLSDILEKCFEKTDVKERLVDLIQSRYGVKAESPFSQYPQYLAFYTAGSRKWFAVFLEASKKSLGLDGEGIVEVVNVKAEAEDIAALVDGNRYFYAYHMNKKSWLSVALDRHTDVGKLMELVDKSFNLTEATKPHGVKK